MKYKDTKTELYWKFENTIVAEVRLELYKPLEGKAKDDFLNRISLCLGEE